ncbi:MAG: YlbF family regulator [Clostridiales bacterium]
MNIYDKTEDLALSIKESCEYGDFLKCKGAIAKNPQAVAMLKEFRQYQIALEFAKISGEGVDEVNAALEAISLEMGNDVEIGEYLTAEYNLSRLIQKIQSILTGELELFVEAQYSEDDIYLN